MAVKDADKQYTVSFEVGATERLKTPIGDLDAWQVKTSIVATNGETAAKNVALWMSNDSRRVPVKGRADLPFRSFTLGLRDVRWAGTTGSPTFPKKGPPAPQLIRPQQ